jgi:hypothetical protein
MGSMWRVLSLGTAVAIAGCGGDGDPRLAVDLKTDFVPAVEFDRIETELSSGGSTSRIETVPAAGADFLRGLRIADLRGKRDPSAEVVVRLSWRGAEVAVRRVRLELRSGTRTTTVVISRSCGAVICPGAGDPEGATECLAGRCVPPTCERLGDPECGMVECTADTGCTAATPCASASCSDEGVCLFGSDETACAAGEYCDPERGCRPVPMPVPDAGPAPDGSPPEETLDYDVVVAGAGPGGVAAAIAASRLGARVVLLEETDWIGGQMTAAAVSTMDGQNSDVDGNGLYGEMVARVRTHYGTRPIGTCYWQTDTVCFEASVGQTVLRAMLDEAGVDVRERARVTAVDATRSVVTGVRAVQPDARLRITSRVVIDGTEYGDLLPLAPVRYRVGTSTGESPIPGQCLQDITYTAVIRRHPVAPPPELVLRGAPPGYSPAIEADFAEVIALGGTSGFRPGAYPYDWPTHNAYRGVPNPLDATHYTALERDRISKTGVNWANDFPSTVAYVEDLEVRRATTCAAKLRTLQFLWYVQNVLGERSWSVAAEEGFDTAYNREDNDCPEIPVELAAIERHFPVIPYVREGRRMIGRTTLTVADIRREGVPVVPVRRWETSIAVGDYGSDLHGCNCADGGDAVLEAGLERCTDIGPEAYGWFQVPVEVLVPESADGFLAVEKNISVSRLVNGAIRLQPIAMYTGQAAGVLAALAVRDRIALRAVRPIDVLWVLDQPGARISAVL